MKIYTFELILLIYCSSVDIGLVAIQSLSLRLQPSVHRSDRL